MFKIFYIVNARIPTEKPHGLQVMKTIEAFQKQGVDVELLLPRRKNRIKEGIKEYYNLQTEIRPAYIANYFGFLQKSIPWAYFKIQRFLFTFYAFLRGLKSKADCIYSREITISFLLSLFGKNVVYEDHEPKKSKLFIYKLFLKIIKKKIIVPYNLGELYWKLGIKQKSYIIVPNGIDLEEFKHIDSDKVIWQKEFNFERGDKIVLYVGHFYRWKGIYTLIDSSKYLSNRIKIVLIGAISLTKDNILKYLEKEKIKNVFIRDFVPHREIIKYIKSADILVLPNTAEEERSAKYTTPIKLFEYMASDVPVVASNLPSFNNYFKDGQNAMLFEPDNPRDLADKINYLMNNKEVGGELASFAIEDAKDYTWDKRAQKILEFIEK